MLSVCLSTSIFYSSSLYISFCLSGINTCPLECVYPTSPPGHWVTSLDCLPPCLSSSATQASPLSDNQATDIMYQKHIPLNHFNEMIHSMWLRASAKDQKAKMFPCSTFILRSTISDFASKTIFFLLKLKNTF